ncbi:MAG: XRE family transcriptional regulator [Acidobacteriales bacterium]|nr:XRE family transcriptional regulator [Terriglobales bacterium]
MRTGVVGFQGARLREAREALGLSITSLADIVGVSKQAVSQYEKGADSPGTDVFDRLRATLKHEAHFFLRRPNTALAKTTCFYRSMASATKTARNRAEVWQQWTRELVSYLFEFVEIPPTSFGNLEDVPADPHLLGMDKIEALAADARECWRLGDGPIPNLVETAENSGAIVARFSLNAETLDALSQWLEPERLPFIVLNADKDVSVRSRLDLAHELGHVFLHRGATQDQLRRPELFRLIEDQAFRFGAAFLLPEHSFLEELYSLSLDGLLSVKPKWKVSVAMMIERLKDLGIVNDSQHQRLRINYSARQWSKEEPYDNEMLVEQPTLLARTLKLVVESKIHTVDQISANTGFSREWIERLLNVPPGLLSPKPELKLLNFKRPA